MSSSCPAGKGSWPELVGMNGEAAAHIIMAENPKVGATTVDENAIVTTDFRCDRVRVFVNDHGIVTRVPRIG
ncbi:hypothetical protein WN943_028985 [Citrus x changshan-huyou]|uniref:Uncharacterized protein n=1 Tax=Citrus sinensis TaxID=2711 RepID=A0A067DFM5_CITSI|nr:hypothetical protein CISIN_1g038500mg [Citrus sinensis]